ncbi:hypothetical protein KGF57_004562 [Candida theae]|uniref:Ribonucleases P/MRP subunit Pop8-like domain-containing protein n=1 Tax=Candida theae TaxID=1198502 RepID=A0AAD5BBS9_9ASCO|nr:uncharacterized protein KGF57_004562 [Candida theae]KAI5949739.1 hypothetical protein KGF57_004562 [Candida theae]
MNNEQIFEDEDDWLYLRLEIFPDPKIQHDEAKLKQYEKVDIDLITWKTLIMSSLNKVYGLIGESSPFDIPVKLSTKSTILKIQIQDEEKFSNSFLSYAFDLSKYTDVDVDCCIKIAKKARHVALVIEEK